MRTSCEPAFAFAWPTFVVVASDRVTGQARVRRGERRNHRKGSLINVSTPEEVDDHDEVEPNPLTLRLAGTATPVNI